MGIDRKKCQVLLFLVKKKKSSTNIRPEKLSLIAVSRKQ